MAEKRTSQIEACPVIAIVSVLVLSQLAAAQQPIAWRQGGDFQNALAAEVWLSQPARPVRPFLKDLSEAQRVVIFVDRRIDTSRSVPLEVSGQSLEFVLRQIAEALNGSLCCVDSVVYIGPVAAAERLATLAANKRDQAAKSPRGAREKWLRREPWRWEELSTPKELLSELAERSEISLENIDVVPHDLWPSVALPPLPLIDRFTLVLAGFDLTLEFGSNGEAARIVASPDDVWLERNYSIDGLPAARVNQLVTHFPRATIRRRGTRISVKGSHQDHEGIARELQGRLAASDKARNGELRFRLIEVKNKSVGDVLQEVAKPLGLVVVISSDAESATRQLITFSKKDATFDELMEAALSPVGLQFRVDEQRLLITLR
jgi:hypothetical protein